MSEEARQRADQVRKHAEALADQEQRFASSLIEAMPGIFYLYDENGQFLRWNRNFEAVSGYSASEIATMRPVEFFTGNDQQLLARRIAEVFEKGEASVEASFVTKDGRALPYFFTGRRIVFEGVPCLVGVGVDISERIRAQEALSKSEQRYRTTLDSTLEGCQLLGFDWRYLYLNPAAAIQNRRPNVELLGQDDARILAWDRGHQHFSRSSALHGGTHRASRRNRVRVSRRDDRLVRREDAASAGGDLRSLDRHQRTQAGRGGAARTEREPRA